MTEVTELTYNPGDPALKVDPYAFYQRLRDEAPVLHCAAPTPDAEDFYVLTRYDDIATLLRDKDRVSAHVVDRLLNGAFLDLPAMVNSDAPVHTKLRRVTNRALGPRAIGALPPRVQQLIDELIEEMLSKPEAEFVHEFATELPLRLVGEMLGIPLDRKADITRWSEAVLETASLIGGGDPDLVPGCTEDFLALVNFIDEQAIGRVGCPHQGDLLSDLVSREASGELTHDEVVAMGWSFLAAGKDTTMYLLGGGMRMLLADPQMAERLIAEPEKTENFIEECLRFSSPTQLVLRRLKEDIELHGVVMRAGSLVDVLVGAGNRDPRKFPDPDVFDIDRANASDHLAFGGGPHFCPGIAMARMLAGLAFRALYPHLHRLSLDPQRPPRMRVKPGAFGIDYMGILVSQDTPALATATA
jgi:cytochrome P450